MIHKVFDYIDRGYNSRFVRVLRLVLLGVSASTFAGGIADQVFSILSSQNLYPALYWASGGCLFLFFLSQVYDNTKLKSFIHDGFQVITNDVTIKVDVDEKIYDFTFEKEILVRANSSPKWVKGQFYCNKFLKDSDESRAFYRKNPIKWETLEVYAQIAYRDPSKSDFIGPHKVRVRNNADVGNFIPFNILYKVEESDLSLPIKKGTIMKLTYGYKVSAELWGSYLNRTLSYWAEEANVNFVYPSDSKTPVSVTLYSRPPNMDPEICDVPVDVRKNGRTITHSVRIPKKTCGKYAVWWNSAELCGIPPTEMTRDESNMTDF